MKTTSGLAALVTLLVLAFAAGCGPQTGDANQLVHEAGNIIYSVSGQLKQADTLMSEAAAQSNQRQLETEKTTLLETKKIVTGAIPQIQSAQSKIDEAGGLEISSAFHQYLQAKSKALAAALALRQTQLQKINLMLADPGLDNQASQKQFAQLQQQEAQQDKNVQDAENEADTIANAHPNEIQ